MASLKLPIKTSTANTAVDAEVDASVESLLAQADYIINNADEFLTEGGALVAETEAAVA